VRQRVLVGGISGAGKTTLARELARHWDLPHVELDALFHGPGWTERPTFAADVADVAAGERWVVDSDGYSAVRDVLWARADTLLWLDLPRWQVMLRVVRRSVWRGLRRAELWNGNRESFRGWKDSGHPVWWAWHQHAARRATIASRVAGTRWQHLEVVRLRSARQVRRWRREHLAARSAQG
jgi:adenylate kinase family enzyme